MTAASLPRRLRRSTIGLTSATMIGCVLLLVISGAGASSPSLVKHAPYRVVKDLGKDSFKTNGTANITATAPRFNGGKGLGLYASKAVVPVCHGLCNELAEDNIATLQFWIQLKVPAAATSIAVNSSLSLAIITHQHLGICKLQNVSGVSSECSLRYFWYFDILGSSLYDNTTGKSLRPTTQNFSNPPTRGILGYDWGKTWQNVSSCTPTSSGNVCSTSSNLPKVSTNTNSSWWNEVYNITPAAGQQYFLEYSFFYVNEVNVTTVHAKWSSVSASIQYLMATFGRGFYLNSVTIT